MGPCYYRHCSKHRENHFGRSCVTCQFCEEGDHQTNENDHSECREVPNDLQLLPDQGGEPGLLQACG